MSKSNTDISFPKFTIDENGLFVQTDATAVPIPLGTPLDLIGSYRIEASKQRLIKYRFKDQTGKLITGFIKRGEITAATTLYKNLVGAGWTPHMSKNSDKLLAEYFLRHEPQKVVTLTSRIGWRGNAFGWPGKTIKHKGELFRYARSAHAHKINLEAVKADAWEWDMHVGHPATSSNALIFAICLALAALVRRKFTKIPGGGFHLYGPSSIGKTTALLIAHSIIGKPDGDGLFTWDTTGAGLEETAIQHRDILLCLDDTANMSKAKNAAQIIHETAFLLSGRKGRTRSQQYAKKAKVVTDNQNVAPDVLYLSTGECSMRDIALSNSETRLAGSEVRLVDIPVGDTGLPWGIFDSLPDEFTNLPVPESEKARRLQKHILAECEEIYGVIGRKFTDVVSNKPKSTRKSFDGYLQNFMDLPTGFDAATDMRIKERFALVYAAGMLASEFDVLSAQMDEFIHKAVVWAYTAAMTARYKPVEGLAASIAKVRERVSEITGAGAMDFDTMLKRLGGFTDPKDKYNGLVLLRHKTLTEILGSEGLTATVVDALDKAGCIRHKAKPGQTRTVVYNRGKKRLRVLLIDVAQLQTA